MSGPVQPPLTVETVDGATVGRPITRIKVTNGTLTVSGNTATIVTGAGGGGGSGTVTSITPAADSGTGTAITTAGTLTYTGGTGITTSVSGTTVTINADNNGTVTGVTGSAPISSTGGTSPTISIAQSDATTDGYLSSTDWSTFNSKGSGTITGSATATQVSYGAATANEITSSSNLTFDGTNLNVAGYVEVGTKVTTPTGIDLTLDTDSGTDSGSIIIADGVNGQVSISANGTGPIKLGAVTNPVTVSNVYTLPTVVTTDNNYVLTAQTDGSTAWAASGGGGGGIGGSITDNQVAVGASTANEIEGSSDFTYNALTGLLTVGEKIDSSGTNTLQLIAGTSSISILDSGVANHINITPASGRINAQASTLSVGSGSADTTISSNGAHNLTLNTNDGTNSGSIVIADGVNGQISITPNGTGTIKLDGVELDNSAINTGYVLKATSTTAAGWAAESGGGSTPKFSGVKANGNAYYDLSAYPTGWRTTTYSNITENQAAPIYSPFTCGMDLTLSTLGIEVSVAGDTGLNYLLAIYSVDVAGLPDSKLVSATVSADATGTQTATVTETSAGDGDLVAGTQYYYAYTQSFDAVSNPTLRSAGAQFHGSFTDSTIGTQRQAIRAGSQGVLPATYPGSGIVLGVSVAIVGCTYG